MSFGTKSNKEKVSANSFEIYKGKFLKIQRKQAGAELCQAQDKFS